MLTRNLLLKDKKHGLFLVSTWDHRDTKDTKTLAEKLGLKGKTNLRLCDEETLLATCGVTKGSLSYLAAINDVKGEVKVAMDKALFTSTKINGHPLRCDRTTAVAPAGKSKPQPDYT